jgi:hypothetical protein
MLVCSCIWECCYLVGVWPGCLMSSTETRNVQCWVAAYHPTMKTLTASKFLFSRIGWLPRLFLMFFAKKHKTSKNDWRWSRTLSSALGSYVAHTILLDHFLWGGRRGVGYHEEEISLLSNHHDLVWTFSFDLEERIFGRGEGSATLLGMSPHAGRYLCTAVYSRLIAAYEHGSYAKKTRYFSNTWPP